MHRIAQEAGIGQGTLYRRFPNKSKLCFSLMEKKFHDMADDVKSYLENTLELSVKDRLCGMMTLLLYKIDSDLSRMKALFHSEKLEGVRDCQFEIEPVLFVKETVKELLTEADSRKELIPMDLDFAAILIASAWNPEMIFYLHDLGYDTGEIARRYCECSIEPLFVPTA